MKQNQERTTYESKDAIYNLNPAHVFNVVADLVTYLNFAKAKAMKDNPNKVRSSASLYGNERKLTLHTDVVEYKGFFSGFDLAELVLSADNSKLTLTTHKHPRVAIPSQDLEFVAKTYIMK